MHSAQPINLGKPEMHDTFDGFKFGKISFSQSPHESFDEEIYPLHSLERLDGLYNSVLSFDLNPVKRIDYKFP